MVISPPVIRAVMDKQWVIEDEINAKTDRTYAST